MGNFLYCDLCGTPAPIRDSLHPITIGKVQEAEACLSCAEKIRRSLRTQQQSVFSSLRNPPKEEEQAVQPAGS